MWIDDCTKQTLKSVLLVLIGNKSDLNDKREVSYEEGDAYAKSHKMIFLESSAKTGDNINEIFEESADIRYRDRPCRLCDRNVFRRSNRYVITLVSQVPGILGS